MHAIQIHDVGPPPVMKLETISLDPPGPEQVKVKHTAIGVNFIDTYHRSGLYPLPKLPHGLGTEAAGVVTEIGSQVETFKIGDRVAYVTTTPGTYAEENIVPWNRLVPVPDDISDEIAAASLLKGMTVEYLLQRTYRVQKDDWVLFHAAAGGVGLLACQWLKSIGARVIGTVSTAEKSELALKHGCTFTVNYKEEDFVARVQELTEGKGVNVVYDSVGKTTLLPSLECLRPRGIFVSFGNASGKPDPLDLSLLAGKGSLYVTRPNLFHYIPTREELLASANKLFTLIGTGELTPEVTHRWALEEAIACHEALEGRRTTGASVLIPSASPT